MSQISPRSSSISSPQAKKPRFLHPWASWLFALWKFSRPHTILGTTLSVVALFLIAWPSSGESVGAASLGLFLPALIACLGGNIYIVGLNQLEDIAIDQINKPHLPLASGEFSRRTGWSIVILSGAIALLLPLAQGWFLTATVWLSLLIGTAYSLPPLRLKRFPVWASLCIFTVRGVIVNLGLYSHFSDRLALEATIPPIVWALTAFIVVFTFAIAIYKDIPDIEGDRRYNINTLTLRLGQRAVLRLALAVLTLCYLGMIVAGVWLPDINTAVIVLTHSLALVALWWQGLRVNLHDKAAIARSYQFIWKLFFLEYLILPVAYLLR